MTTRPTFRKKLIEVDLPLDAINKESAREKSIRHGHPSTLHLWWARRPLASCRAVIFASMVDDPSSCPDEFPTEEDQRVERDRLHDLIKRLVIWENSNDDKLLAEARYEIARSVARSHAEPAPLLENPTAVLHYLNDKALPIYDPFCGGGSIPLEAQRLGMRAVGSDLNPVAVLITKALIELPPRFANQPPVNPDANTMGIMVGKGKRARQVPWRGASGLADDIRYYGRKMREMAWERIGRYYPKAKLPSGGEATVIAWLWARTVPCPNPACGVAMPLMRTFQLSTKSNNRHWTKPIVDRDSKTISFEVQNHSDGVPSGTVASGSATCVACGSVSPLSYVREQARAGMIGEQMTGIVAEGDHKRLFLSPTDGHIQAAEDADPTWRPSGRLPDHAMSLRVQGYGVTEWHELYSSRQLTALTQFSDLIGQTHQMLTNDGKEEGYANAVITYLALTIGRTANSCSRSARWQNSGDFIAGVFARQAVSMLWDFAESNPFCTATQNWMAQVEWVAKVVERLPIDVNPGESHQADASTTTYASNGPVIVTDPPYYDNIGYADLSDYFYIWLRPLLRGVYPDLFGSILTPKEEEMVAAPVRFDNPRQRFEELLNRTLELVRERCSPGFPSSIFYAYKQQEEEKDGRTSTGWETMLAALVDAGFQIVGTWPMRTERANRPRAQDSNALASSVVLVCRPRPEEAPVATRRQFLDALEKDLPIALDQLTYESHIAPVDLAQAAIGPGMEVYSRYGRVETIGGDPVPVREALAAINRIIAEHDERQQGNLDSTTRFCLDWLRQHGYGEGRYGEAETLAQAKNVSVEELRDSRGLLTAVGGAVSLLPIDEYGPGRRPRLGEMTAWEGACRMAYHLSWEDGRGVVGAADVAAGMGSNVESVERLARILYNHYDRKGDSRNSVLFNNLVVEWPNILARMQAPEQGRMI